MSASTPDSEGYQPYNQAIDEDEDLHTTYETDAPIGDIIAGIRDRGVPARVSRNAGRFIENCLYYKTLDFLGGIKKNRPKALLIHLPLPGLRPFGDLEEPPWDMEQLALGTQATMKAIAACYAP
jgi:pyrrolidone-carboxylate peptidase